jgi:hypothetical protein
MFDGIEMNVMQMAFQILITPNNMIPKSFLPEFNRLRRWKPKLLLVFPGKVHLERVHDVAEITFPYWLNNDMEMLQEKYVSQHCKRMNFADLTKDSTQQIHVPGITKNMFAILDHLRYKHRRTRNIITMKIHRQIIAVL